MNLRDEALLLLDAKGAIIETAREVSELLRDRAPEAAVVGGIAVVLHGYVRTTVDVDVFVPVATEGLRETLETHGFDFDPAKREFVRDGVPIHLVTLEQLGNAPRERVEIDGVTTVSLADLIEMKLRSGTKNILRAIDLADVIGLIRAHGLRGDFTARLDKSVRPAFRKLVRAIAKE